MPYLMFLSQTVPEICRGPKMPKVGHVALPGPIWPNFSFLLLVPPVINPHTEFVVSSSNRFRDNEGVPKISKVGHVTPSQPPLTYFSFLLLLPPVINLHAKFEVSSSNVREIRRGCQNFKSRSCDRFPTPFDLIFHFYHQCPRSSICIPNL